MSRFSHILFDLDGTLADNTQGIENSLRYALAKMHINEFPENTLENFIGPPLQWGFSSVYGMNKKEVAVAVDYFREYYSEHGWHQNIPYPGIMELLAELHQKGVKMYIATAKLELFAQRIIRHFEMDRYIIQLRGADYGGKKATKADIIADLIYTQKLQPSKNIAMVGDTPFDMDGGKANGLATVAVDYGFGKTEELKNTVPDYFVPDVETLAEVLLD